MAPVMTNMPGASEHERAVDSELALLVSEYLQFHHCTGAHEVSKWLQHLSAVAVHSKRWVSGSTYR